MSDLKDVDIMCKECREHFTLTVREQEFYHDRGWQWPKRCSSCRKERKERSRRDKKDIVQTRHECICDKCNKNTTVPFVPDGRKPVLCKECYRAQDEKER